MDCMEIDMEQNEQKEDKGVENFADQGKNKNIVELKEKKADRCATFSMIFLVLGCCLLFFFIKICDPLVQGRNEMLTMVVLCVSAVMYLISLIMCIFGSIIMKTKNVKMMLLIHVLCVLGAIIGWFVLYGIIYMIFGWFK